MFSTRRFDDLLFFRDQEGTGLSVPRHLTYFAGVDCALLFGLNLAAYVLFLISLLRTARHSECSSEDKMSLSKVGIHFGGSPYWSDSFIRQFQCEVALSKFEQSVAISWIRGDRSFEVLKSFAGPAGIWIDGHNSDRRPVLLRSSSSPSNKLCPEYRECVDHSVAGAPPCLWFVAARSGARLDTLSALERPTIQLRCKSCQPQGRPSFIPVFCRLTLNSR